MLSPQSHMGGCLPLSSFRIDRPVSAVSTTSPSVQSSPGSPLERSDILSTVVVPASSPAVDAAADTRSSVGSIWRFTPQGSKPATTSRLATIRAAASDRGLSASASRLWVSSWRSSTQSSYESAWNIWIRWCQQESLNPLESDEETVANFLAAHFTDRKQYCTLKCLLIGFFLNMAHTG